MVGRGGGGGCGCDGDVVGRVEGDVFNVLCDCFLDFPRADSVLECVESLLASDRCWANASYHVCLCVTAEGVFEKSREFRVAVWHECPALLQRVAEDVDTVTESEETLVDVRAFLQTDTAVLRH